MQLSYLGTIWFFWDLLCRQLCRQIQISLWKWSESCSVVSDSLWPNGPCSPWNSPGQNTEVHSLSLLQGIFPTQGLNPSLSHCRRILYQLSHKGSPTILEWVAYPLSSGSSQPRDQTRVFCIAGGFITNWPIKEAHIIQSLGGIFTLFLVSQTSILCHIQFNALMSLVFGRQTFLADFKEENSWLIFWIPDLRI